MGPYSQTLGQRLGGEVNQARLNSTTDLQFDRRLGESDSNDKRTRALASNFSSYDQGEMKVTHGELGSYRMDSALKCRMVKQICDQVGLRKTNTCPLPQFASMNHLTAPKKRLQVNSRSIRRGPDPREQCCGSADGAGSFSGISRHMSSVNPCTICPQENGENPPRRPPRTVPRSHVDQASVKNGFWLKQNEASPIGHINQDQYLPSSFDNQLNSFTKAITDQESKASQLSGKVETLEIQEIESLKAQMALLCERLAWHVSRCSKRPCKAGAVNSFDSEESLLLKGIGVQLKKVITVPTGDCPESRREQGKDFEAEYPDGQEIQDICRCRNLAWKCGINTLFQALLWCIGFMMTIVRRNSVPMLLPT